MSFMYSSLSKVTAKFSAACKLWLVVLLLPCLLSAQQGRNDSLIQNATLENVVHYAIQRNQSLKMHRLMKK